jgi:hypothetical protein
MKSWPDSVLSNKLSKLGFLKPCHEIAIVTRFTNVEWTSSCVPNRDTFLTIMLRFYFLQNLQLFILFLLFKLACELKISWIYNKNNVMTTVITTPNLNHSLSSRNLFATLTIDSKIKITWSSDNTPKFISRLAKYELVWLACIHHTQLHSTVW